MIRTFATLSVASVLAACSITQREQREHASVSPVAAPASMNATSPHASKAFPYEIKRATLDNGLQLLMVPMPSDGLVSYWTVVRTGSRDEVEPGVTGFAHFFEHMMFRGTEKLPGKEYDRIVNGMGADANAYTTDDYTAYHLSFAKPDLKTVVTIEADRFQNLKYDEAQFKTESGAVYGEYRKGRTSPFEVLFEAVQNAAFDAHTYKHTTIGFEADIKAMPEHFEYSKGFFQRFYRPENAVVLITGDFDPKQAEAWVREHYSGWKKGYQTPKVPAEPAQTAQRRIDVPFEGQTLPLLSINFKGERFLPNDRTMMAATLLGDLAFGETAPVYKKLVLDEQRVEMLLGWFSYSRDPGLWSVIARVKDAADVQAVEGELWAAIDQIRRDGVPAERLDAVRSRLKYGFLSSLSTPQNVAENVAQLIALTGGLDVVETMYATLAQVTPKDVQNAVERYLTPQRSTVALLHSSTAVAAEATAASGEKPVLMPVPEDPNVAFKLWFKVGSQDDPPGKEGLANMVASLISEGGTQKRSYDEMLQELFPMAGGYGVSVDKEMTVVSGVVHRDHAEDFYALLSEAVTKPGFRADDFARLRDATISGIENTLRFSSDEELGKATLYNRVFAGTPYAHIVEGTVESLKSITLEDVGAFWRKHYTRGNVVVALGGAFDETLAARVRADMARLPEGHVQPMPAPTPQPIAGRRVQIVAKPGDSTAISFGYPIDVRRGSREFYALWIANSWLGEHRNSASRLYQVIREARGINYGDYSYIEAFPNGGRRSMPPTGVGRRQQMFEVWVRPVPEAVAVFSLRAALREVDKLSKNGLTREQFEFTRKFLKNYSLHFAETTAESLGYAVDDRFYGVDGHLATFRRMMDEITHEEVNAAIKKHLQVENLEIALVTENAEKIRDALVSDAASPIDYGDVPKPMEILDEDREIASYPLRIQAEDVTITPVEQMFAGAKP